MSNKSIDTLRKKNALWQWPELVVSARTHALLVAAGVLVFIVESVGSFLSLIKPVSIQENIYMGGFLLFVLFHVTLLVRDCVLLGIKWLLSLINSVGKKTWSGVVVSALALASTILGLLLLSGLAMMAITMSRILLSTANGDEFGIVVYALGAFLIVISDAVAKQLVKNQLENLDLDSRTQK